MMKEFNLIEATDSYKVTHFRQYPPQTQRVYSFYESRGGEFPEVVFFGLQYIAKRYLAGPVVSAEDIEEMREEFALHFGNTSLFNQAGWERIVNVHGGCLPVEIRAIPEGTPVPTHNVMMTVVNTDLELPWLTNYLETLLCQVWYPCTVATQSREMKRIILRYLTETGDPAGINFKLHDFGFRGSTTVESAGIGGCAHLVNFQGTDTMQALRVARKYYCERMAGFSIPAAEHSTITSWGRENEVAAYANMLRAFPSGLVAVVSDSYNIYEACSRLWGEQLRSEVLSRDGTLVVRPDSGNPTLVVPHVLEALGEAFGYEVNGKGFKVLNPKVRVIQGDGIDFSMLGSILETMKAAGWSADNIAFGSGGGLLQKMNRDTCKFAFKCSAVQIDGGWQDVMKDPVTDPGKRSKAGRLALVCDKDNAYATMRQEDASVQGYEDLLIPVFRNGEVLIDQTLADIRERAAI
jgi:nicotinamide phosphoribosyltransferase